MGARGQGIPGPRGQGSRTTGPQLLPQPSGQPNVAFRVKQKALGILDDAVAATIELESYLSPKMTVVALDTESASQEPADVGAVSQVHHDKLKFMFEQLVGQLDKLKAACQGKRDDSQRPRRSRNLRGRFQHQDFTC